MGIAYEPHGVKTCCFSTIYMINKDALGGLVLTKHVWLFEYDKNILQFDTLFAGLGLSFHILLSDQHLCYSLSR